MVDAGAHHMIQLCCDDKFMKHGEISKVLFRNWAWITIHGDLKDEPSLMWLEREDWHERVAQVAEGTQHDDDEDIQRPKKRPRADDDNSAAEPRTTRAELSTSDSVVQLEKNLEDVRYHFSRVGNAHADSQ